MLCFRCGCKKPSDGKIFCEKCDKELIEHFKLDKLCPECGHGEYLHYKAFLEDGEHLFCKRCGLCL